MTWIKIDDQLPDHPKVLDAGPAAAWLYVCGLCYASRYLTDGFVPAGVVSRLSDLKRADDVATRLVDAGLWETADGGYRIHDYLDYQRSAAEVDEVSAKRAEAGRRGGARSGEARREAKPKQTPSNLLSKTEANDQAKSKQTGKQNSSRVQNTDTDTEKTPSSEGETSRAPAKGTFPIPENLAMTADDADSAKGHGLSEAEAAEEWEHFRSHYAARQGERRSDWHAQWRTWLGKRRQFPARTAPNGAVRATPSLDAARYKNGGHLNVRGRPT